jgi:PAS domain S-box-containing protein
MTSPVPASNNNFIADTWIADVFDNAPLGVLQVDLKGTLQYVNAEACRIFGIEQWRGKAIFDFSPNLDTTNLMKAKFVERVQGITGDYTIEIKRDNDGRIIPIRVGAMPVFGVGNEINGVVAILRSLEIDSAINSFNHTIANAITAQDVLTGIADTTRQIIPFDLCTVSQMSRDGRHARVLFEIPLGETEPGIRWFPLNSDLAERFATSLTSVWHLDDLLTMRKGIDDVLSRSLTRLIQKGYSWLMRCPAYAEGRQVGTVSLFRKAGPKFSKHEEEVFLSLPLDKAMLVALHFQSRDQVEFRLRLVKEISGKVSDQELFDMLATDIADHYSWSHVSLFTVDSSQDMFVLRSQHASEGYELPSRHTQKLDSGVLGYAYAHGDQNISNVQTDPKFRNIYLHSPMSTRIHSEACLRIIGNGQIYSILNLEDARERAFSTDDIRELQSLLEEIGIIIDRRMKDNLAVAALASTSSAIFVLSQQGTIANVNPAAENLLRRPASFLIGRNIAELIEDSAVAEVLTRSATPRGEASFIRPNEESVRVLIEGVPLDSCFGQRLIVARSFRAHRRAEELESLKGMYAELSRQINTPLSIIGSTLRLLAQRGHTKIQPGKLAADLFKQFRRIELTYDKLLLYSDPELTLQWQPMTIRLSQFVSDAISNLPALYAERITPQCESSVTYVDIDPHQLSFVLETIIAYLLRFLPPAQQIKFLVTDVPAGLCFSLSGPFPEEANEEQVPSQHKRTFSWALDDFVANKTISRFIENHKGSMNAPDIQQNRITFRFVIPVDRTAYAKHHYSSSNA